jgi:hypothetical protein
MKQIFENEKHRFYTNRMTKQLEDHLHRDGDFKHYNVYIAECKVTKARVYVLYNGNEPVYANTKADCMYAHIDILRTLLHF